MRVLDLGTGTGDVARLVAEMVGPAGSVVGVDRSQDALDLVAAINVRRGVTNVRLVRGDLHSLPIDGPFDAVVGRFVLMHVPDAVAAVRSAARLVRPGGVLAFVEPVLLDPAQTIGATPLIRATIELIMRGLRIAGCDLTFGMRLPAILGEVGLLGPQLVSEGIVVAADDPSRFEWPAETLRSLIPALEAACVTTAQELDVETLAQRLAADAIAAGSVVLPMVACGGWARTPPSA
jgi:SAM-dependent methyltransferase